VVRQGAGLDEPLCPVPKDRVTRMPLGDHADRVSRTAGPTCLCGLSVAARPGPFGRHRFGDGQGHAEVCGQGHRGFRRRFVDRVTGMPGVPWSDRGPSTVLSLAASSVGSAMCGAEGF